MLATSLQLALQAGYQSAEDSTVCGANADEA
jgi:hypothetical protein